MSKVSAVSVIGFSYSPRGHRARVVEREQLLRGKSKVLLDALPDFIAADEDEGLVVVARDSARFRRAAENRKIRKHALSRGGRKRMLVISLATADIFKAAPEMRSNVHCAWR